MVLCWNPDFYTYCMVSQVPNLKMLGSFHMLLYTGSNNGEYSLQYSAWALFPSLDRWELQPNHSTYCILLEAKFHPSVHKIRKNGIRIQLSIDTLSSLPCCSVLLHNCGFCNGCITKRCLCITLRKYVAYKDFVSRLLFDK